MNIFKDYNGKLAGRNGKILNAAAGMAGGIAGAAIGGGYSSDAGNIISQLGSLASTIPGVEGLVAGIATPIVGGLANRAFRWKANQENINEINNNIDQLKSFRSNEVTWDAFQANMSRMPSAMKFSNSFVGKNGWLNHKADRAANRLRTQVNDAYTFAANSLINNASNIDNAQASNLAMNYSAYGGPLMMKKGILTPFGKRFNLGGPLFSHGADWTNGIKIIDAGGTHESNPNEGIIMGIDPQGVPNLVEEGEVIWNDYVFSNRLKVPEEIRNKYKLGGKLNMTFADAAVKLQKESEERPNDPISKNGLLTSMLDLAMDQEKIRQAEQEEEAMATYAALGGQLYAKGGSIHIDPKNKGKFNATKKRTGKTTEELTHSKNPLTRKRAIFAQNAKKWKHGLGGNLFISGGPFGMSISPFMDAAEPVKLNHMNLQKDQLAVTPEEYDWWKNLTDYQRIQAANYYYPDYDPDSKFATEELNNDNTKGRHLVSYASKIYGEDLKPASTVKAAYAARDPETGRMVLPEGASLHDFPILQGLDAASTGNLRDRYSVPALDPQKLKGVNVKPVVYNGQVNPEYADPKHFSYDWETGLRYVPALGSALGVFSDLMGWTNKPDYSNADMIVNAARNTRNVKWNPRYNYMKFRPINRMMLINPIVGQANTANRYLMNTGAGNRGNITAGILANNSNMYNKIGEAGLSADAQDFSNYKDVTAANNTINQWIAEGDLKAQMANQNNDATVLNAVAKAAELRNKIDESASAGRSANLTNLFNSLGDIGWEAVNRNMVNDNSPLFKIGRDGHINFTGEMRNYLTDDEYRQLMSKSTPQNLRNEIWNRAEGRRTGIISWNRKKACGGHLTIKGK